MMENLLDNIQASGDVKKLDIRGLKQLCGEIRGFLVENISRTGGHLASNLGVVELTVALHRVFDFPSDKIVFDVGHQAYVHKILTGRKDKFAALRKFGGLSGFPKRAESEYDVFDTGHSSTSVSAALGMARARDLDGGHSNIIALFGDGALTGGEIYEALNDAGHTKTPLILVLNDNTMSIAKNVGAVSRHLRNIRINRLYFRSKRHVSNVLDHIPLAGPPIKHMIERCKTWIRRKVLPTTLFEDMGFKYIGPVNGHDLGSLIACFEYARSEKKPVLIHVKTVKGKGYPPAEKHPDCFHGVGTFDPKTGAIAPGGECYSSRFGKKLIEIAERNRLVTAITCAMLDGTGLVEFSKRFKDRFFDVGIAEQHGVTFAAGMAAAGYTPVIPLYSTFLQRAYDQTLHDVCLQDLHVVFPIDRAGLVGADGETHQGVYDLSYLSAMPNMTVLSPSSFAQLEDMLEYAVNVHKGPIAIRYPRGGTQSPYPYDGFVPNAVYTRMHGHDVTIITLGRMVRRAAEAERILRSHGISAEITEVPTAHPLNEAAIIAAAMKTGTVITIEDNVLSGGFGEHIAALLMDKGIKCAFKSFGFPSVPIEHGTVDELDKKYGTDAQTIADTMIRMVRKQQDGKDKN